MRLSALMVCGVSIFSALSFSASVKDAESPQGAKARLAALPKISLETWKQMLTKHGWLYGSMTAKIKVIGFLTPKAAPELKNVLFGAPNRDYDFVCKTIMLPDTASPTWNLAAKLRIAYALQDPNHYRTPKIVLNQAKQVAEPKVGDFESEWKALPPEVQKQAEEEFDSCTELAKRAKSDTYFMILPDDTIVEIGHPLNIEKVWNDYLSTKG